VDTVAGGDPVQAPAERPGLPARVWETAWKIVLYVVLFAAFAIIGAKLTRGGSFGSVSWTGITVSLLAALLAGWVMLIGVERRPVGALGFALGPAAPREAVAGIGIGGGLIAAAVVLIALTGAAHWIPDDGTVPGYVETLAGGLAFFTLAAALEEVLFRGYPFQVLVRGIGAWPATLLASALFAAMHAANPNVRPLGLWNIFLAGILLSAAYLRTRSLWFATAVHLGWNWTMSSLFDFPVSGLQLDTPLYTAVETGADWWTGGSFGPEAGLAATVVLVAGTAWLLRTPRLRPSDEVRALGPLVDVPWTREPAA